MKAVVWGASGHAKVVADIIRLEGDWEIVGFLDDLRPGRRGEQFCGAEVLGGSERLVDLMGHGVGAIAVGIGACGPRQRIMSRAREEGLPLVTACHPSAIIAGDVVIGRGTVVAAGAVINPTSRIGECAIVNTAASIDHDCFMGAASHVCPRANLAGGVHIGPGSWIGIGASVVDGVNIGTGALVGAGSLVLNDVPDGTVVHGVPARIVRSVSDDDLQVAD